MQLQSNPYLPRAIIIASGLIVLAALIIVLSPLMWSDHLINRDSLPSGCHVSVAVSSGHQGVASCPIWVRW